VRGGEGDDIWAGPVRGVTRRGGRWKGGGAGVMTRRG
jgi:hypothetical protein